GKFARGVRVGRISQTYCHYVFGYFSQCLWCITTKSCVTYPVRTILPPHDLCPLNDARWGLCWMNFQALIITLAVIGGILIIAFLICLFCCCKFKTIISYVVTQRKMFCPYRKAEMRQRHDEIRKKYGKFCHWLTHF
uniref:Uncharacterized protein n=1 Tax=Mola mola TaxID=94237 RepID=A0A3Q4B2M2_MOLML